MSFEEIQSQFKTEIHECNLAEEQTTVMIFARSPVCRSTTKLRHVFTISRLPEETAHIYQGKLFRNLQSAAAGCKHGVFKRVVGSEPAVHRSLEIFFVWEALAAISV